MRWQPLLYLAAVLAATAGEVSLLSEDDSCDVCVIVTRAILKSFREHTSSSSIETGFSLDPAGNLLKKKTVKYNKSETRFIEVMENVCSKMEDYRTNYFDPTMPKFVRRSKDVVSEDGKTRTEFLSTEPVSGNSPAEMMLAIKRQIMSQFGDQIDDSQELKVACDHLLEDWEEALEAWYQADQPDELDHLLCVKQFKSRLNYSCCVEEYPETQAACDARKGRVDEMKRKLSETSKDPTFEEDDSLPPGQMRDEKGVVWQVGDQDKNPFADWAPPQLAEDQIMDERGVIWQVDPEGEAMQQYKKRIARERNENVLKATQWEEARLKKQMEATMAAEGAKAGSPNSTDSKSEPSTDSAAAETAEKTAGQSAKAAASKGEKKTESKGTKKAKPKKLSIDPMVASWLEGIKLTDYAQTFANHGYDDLAVIAEISNEELVDMGIDLPGHRKKILIAARKLAEL